jgi:ABC-2 type transport system permease protein
MTAALRAEWTKFRTLGRTAWLLVGTVLLTVGVTSVVVAATHAGSNDGQDTTKLALVGVDLGQMVIVVLSVLAMSDEYGTGMIRVTLTAMPRRSVLLAAKAINLEALAFVVGVLAVAGCLLAGRLIPTSGLSPAHGYALVSIWHPPTLRAAVGSVIYFDLIALLSLGVATAIRDTPVSIGVVLGLLYLPPVLAQAVADPLRRHIEQIAPMTAGLSVQATTNLRSLPIAPWAGLGILAGWALASLIFGGALLRLRDA